MGDVVYRVTVQYPEVNRYSPPRSRVKYGGKQVVSQTWSYYLTAYAFAQRRADYERQFLLPGVPGKWDDALASAVYKVEAVESVKFIDITDQYDVAKAMEAKGRLRTLNHAA